MRFDDGRDTRGEPVDGAAMEMLYCLGLSCELRIVKWIYAGALNCIPAWSRACSGTMCIYVIMYRWGIEICSVYDD